MWMIWNNCAFWQLLTGKILVHIYKNMANSPKSTVPFLGNSMKSFPFPNHNFGARPIVQFAQLCPISKFDTLFYFKYVLRVYKVKLFSSALTLISIRTLVFHFVDNFYILSITFQLQKRKNQFWTYF